MRPSEYRLTLRMGNNEVWRLFGWLGAQGVCQRGPASAAIVVPRMATETRRELERQLVLLRHRMRLEVEPPAWLRPGSGLPCAEEWVSDGCR